MGSARGKRSRQNPDREPGRRRKAAGRSKETRHHPLFGDVPVLWLPYDADQKCGCWAFDPAYQPELPPGAIRGDVSKQVYCRLCHAPRYYYVDETKQCVQCGQEFVFAAHEQKYWFETLHFHFNSTAIRCPDCRERKRTERALGQQLAEATRAVRAQPRDPGALLEFAQAIVQHHREVGGGDLAKAIAACRAVRDRAPDLLAAGYWEGIGQSLAGRDKRARESLERFLELAGEDKRYRRLVKDAERVLRGGGSTGQVC